MSDRKDWAGLVNVETVSGTAQDPDGSFRGFVTIRAFAEDGSFMVGQLSPDEVRQMGLSFLATAEAADQDAIVFRVLTKKVHVPAEVAAAVVYDMRAERQ